MILLFYILDRFKKKYFKFTFTSNQSAICQVTGKILSDIKKVISPNCNQVNVLELIFVYFNFCLKLKHCDGFRKKVFAVAFTDSRFMGIHATNTAMSWLMKVLY